jgi:hypothetical protein
MPKFLRQVPEGELHRNWLLREEKSNLNPAEVHASFSL